MRSDDGRERIKSEVGIADGKVKNLIQNFNSNLIESIQGSIVRTSTETQDLKHTKVEELNSSREPTENQNDSIEKIAPDSPLREKEEFVPSKWVNSGHSSSISEMEKAKAIFQRENRNQRYRMGHSLNFTRDLFFNPTTADDEKGLTRKESRKQLTNEEIDKMGTREILEIPRVETCEDPSTGSGKTLKKQESRMLTLEKDAFVKSLVRKRSGFLQPLVEKVDNTDIVPSSLAARISGYWNDEASFDFSDSEDNVPQAYSIIDRTPAVNYKSLFADIGEGYEPSSLNYSYVSGYGQPILSMDTLSSSTTSSSDSTRSQPSIISASSHSDSDRPEFDTNMINFMSTELLQDILLKSIDEFGLRKFLIKMVSNDLSTLDMNDIRKFLDYEFYDMIIINHNYEKKIQRDITKLSNKKKNRKMVRDPADYIDFQWIDKFVACETPEEYARLNGSFLSTVEKLCKVIILEKNLPNFKKSIKPISIGGIAGGIKYLTYGILFKFAEDVRISQQHWLYGGSFPDHFTAGKALNNDLKALRALVSSKSELHPLLQTPIYGTVCYLGYTVVAMSFLPLKNNSQCYGTSDAGKSYLNDMLDPVLDEVILSVAKKFKFSQHSVADTINNIYNIYFGADVEMHKAEDVYFILDLGRFFPPNNPTNPFVHQFRAEYLMNEMEGDISCDSFVQFGVIDKEIHNENARQQILQYETYVKDLVQSKEFTFSNRVKGIKDDLHKYGINLRYLGFMRRSLIEKLKLDFWNQHNEGSEIVTGVAVEIKFSFSNEKLKKKKDKKKKSEEDKKKKKDDDSDEDIKEILEVETPENIQNKMNQDYILMEMILRSCKTILQKKLMAQSENQVIPNSDSFDEITYKFHRTVSDQNNRFWKARLLRHVIREKFGIFALSDSEMTSSKSILEYFHFPDHIPEVIQLIPKYCHYKGGTFLFEIKNKLNSKSSIPEITAEYIISEMTGLVTQSQLEEYWKIYKHLPAQTIITLAIICWQKCTNDSTSNSVYIDWIKSNPSTLLFQEDHSNLSNFEQYDKELPTRVLEDKSLTFYLSDLAIERFPNDDTIKYCYPSFNGFQCERADDHLLFGLTRLHMTKVDISKSGDVTDYGLDYISNLKKMKWLSVAHCKGITDKGISYIKNTNIEYLDISCATRLRNPIVSVSNMDTLTHLEMSGLLLTDISSLKKLVNLTHLNMKECAQLESISDLGKLENLTYLNLTSCNKIIKKDFGTLGSLTKLKTLELESCLVTYGSKQNCAKDTAFLRSLSKLTKLNMKNCLLMDSVLENLCSLSKLEHLNFSGNMGITGETSDTGYSSIHLLPSIKLQTLKLNSTSLTDTGLNALTSFATLMFLEVECCDDISDEGLENFSALTGLKKLSLKGSKNISDYGLVHLLELRNLQNVTLASCGSFGGSEDALDFIVNCDLLRRLDVSDCLINTHSFERICNKERLQTLNLSKSNIDDSILKSIEKLKDTLSSLNVSHTFVSGSCLKQVSKLETLTDLNLENTRTGGNIMEISNLTNLKVLNLSDTGVSLNKGLSSSTLYKALRRMSSLDNLNLSRNRGINGEIILGKLPNVTFLNLTNCKYLSSIKPSDTLQLKTLLLRGCIKLRARVFSELSCIHSLVQLDLSKIPTLLTEDSKSKEMFPPNVEKLNLEGSFDFHYGFQKFSSMPNLTDLNISFLKDDEGESTLDAFIYSEDLWSPMRFGLANLTKLNLSRTPIINDCLQYVSSLDRLETLIIDWCMQVTSDSMVYLARHPSLTKLSIIGCPLPNRLNIEPVIVERIQHTLDVKKRSGDLIRLFGEKLKRKKTKEKEKDNRKSAKQVKSARVRSDKKLKRNTEAPNLH